MHKPCVPRGKQASKQASNTNKHRKKVNTPKKKNRRLSYRCIAAMLSSSLPNLLKLTYTYRSDDETEPPQAVDMYVTKEGNETKRNEMFTRDDRTKQIIYQKK
mmetsp:Transcript_31366/g.75897  ORF Transcript_31366/g.75897 Transcript_31366/m.75897 type:complete len:103 (+) Transcript_31366:1343-1651(+)